MAGFAGRFAQRDEGPVEGLDLQTGAVDRKARQDGVELRAGEIDGPDQHGAVGGRCQRWNCAAIEGDLDQLKVWPLPLDERTVVGRIAIDIDRTRAAAGLR